MALTDLYGNDDKDNNCTDITAGCNILHTALPELARADSNSINSNNFVTALRQQERISVVEVGRIKPGLHCSLNIDDTEEKDVLNSRDNYTCKYVKKRH